MKLTRNIIRNLVEEEIQKEGIMDVYKKLTGSRDEGVPSTAPVLYYMELYTKGNEIIPAYPVPVPPGGDPESFANDMVKLINKEREGNNLLIRKGSLKEPQGN